MKKFWMVSGYIYHLFDFIPCGLCHVRMAMKENYYEMIWYFLMCILQLFIIIFCYNEAWNLPQVYDYFSHRFFLIF